MPLDVVNTEGYGPHHAAETRRRRSGGPVMVRRVSSRLALAATASLLLGLLGTSSASADGSYAEQQGHNGVNTFQNYHNASGLGPRIDPRAWVNVSCKVYDPYIQSADPDGYWYRIASAPWNDQYYAPANTFMNGDPWGGPYTHNTDFNVPDCGATPAPAPSVTLSQGPAAPAGYRYAIALNNFAANASISVSCYDSVSPGGFYTFNLTTNGSGSASTAAYCYSGDGPDHWVVAGGVESNHVSWSGSPTPPSPPTPPPGDTVIDGVDVGVAQNQPHAWGSCTVQDFNGGPYGWVIVSYTNGTYVVRNGMLWGWLDNGGGPGFGCPVDEEHAVGAQQRQNFMTGTLYWVSGMDHARRLPTIDGRASNALSGNWSGAVVTSRRAQPTLDGSTVTYRIPPVVCGAGEESTTAVWTGIGGAKAGGDNTLYQAGTSSMCTNGAAQYAPWFEIESNPKSIMNFHGGKPLPHAVAANDLMKVTVRVIYSRSSGRYVTHYDVADQGPVNRWRQQFNLPYYSDRPSTRASECIVESPTDGATGASVRLASFGEAHLNCGVYRGGVETAIDRPGAAWNLALYGITGPGGYLLADARLDGQGRGNVIVTWTAAS